jgi:hypothetical protein
VKGSKRRKARSSWAELGFASKEAMVRAIFGIPDDAPFKIKRATRPLVLEIGPGTKIEPVKDRKGNVVGCTLAGDLSRHELH